MRWGGIGPLRKIFYTLPYEDTCAKDTSGFWSKKNAILGWILEKLQ